MQKKSNTTISFIKTVMVLVVITAVFTVSKTQAQWVAQPSNLSVNSNPQYLDAVDANVCWALSTTDEFTRTFDGGQTWISGFVTNATGMFCCDLTAISANTAWAAYYDLNGGPSKVLKTVDGGLNWVHQASAAFNSVGSFPDIIHFWDANNGVCVGDPADGYFEIYTTTDGGDNWVRVPSANIPAYLAGEAGIVGVATSQGDSAIYFGTNVGRIYKSTDRGLNWTAAATPFQQYVGAIAFRDANNGLVTMAAATPINDLAQTTDGGATWTLLTSNSAGLGTRNGLCYVPGTDSTYFTTAFQGTQNGSAYSPNNGNAWLLQDNIAHTDIQFVNDSIGWTGSLYGGSPIYKWSTPVVTATNDVSVKSVDVSNAVGLITQTPKATVFNNGFDTQTFDVTMTITGGYTSTKTVSNLSLANSQQVTFDPWTPAAIGAYTVTVYTQLGTDTKLTNDTLTSTTTVYDVFENYGWTTRKNTLTSISGSGSAFILNGTTATSPGQLLTIGGAPSGTALSTVRSYATVANTWSTKALMPSAKGYITANTIGDKTYCAGGYGSAGISPQMYIYNATTNTWSTGTDMPIPTADYASGVFHDTLIYYIGGGDSIAETNVVQIYNTINNTWTTATSKPGIAASAIRGAIVDNTIIVAGGLENQGIDVTAAAYKGIIDIANPANITWTAIADYPTGPLFGLAAGTSFLGIKPMVFFAGGAGLTDVQNGCWAYDIATDQWKIGAPKTTATYWNNNFVGLVYNDSLWMASVGGRGAAPSYAATNVNEWLNIGLCPALSLGITTIDDAVINSLVYPNPVINTAIIKFVVTKTDKVTVSLLDVTGRTITTLADETMNPGEQRLEWNAEKINAGVYFIKIQIGANSKLEKITVTK